MMKIYVRFRGNKIYNNKIKIYFQVFPLVEFRVKKFDRYRLFVCKINKKKFRKQKLSVASNMAPTCRRRP